MNIYASENDTVKFLNKNGTDWDRQYANKHLKEGEILTVDNVYVGNFNSDVEFKEHPGIRFNTVMFEDVNVDVITAQTNMETWRKNYIHE